MIKTLEFASFAVAVVLFIATLVVGSVEGGIIGIVLMAITGSLLVNRIDEELKKHERTRR